MPSEIQIRKSCPHCGKQFILPEGYSDDDSPNYVSKYFVCEHCSHPFAVEFRELDLTYDHR
jgi:DNA-directed RNA polymerase subunit RPC12/RpoP